MAEWTFTYRAARLADITPVARPEHHRRPGTTGSPDGGILHLPPGRRIRIDRQRAWPYDGHGRLTALGSLLAVGAKRGEEGSITFNGTAKSWPAPAQPASNMTKERGRAPAPDTQEVRPSAGVPWGAGARQVPSNTPDETARPTMDRFVTDCVSMLIGRS